MAYKYREDLVGKRFLSVSGVTKINVNTVSQWGWKAGVIRAASLKDNNNKELQVLVEYDGLDWQCREWVAVYSRRTFRLFLVERTLVWGSKIYEDEEVKWPALTFTPLAADLTIPADAQPLEFLHDKQLDFVNYTQLQPFQEWDAQLAGSLNGVDTELLASLSAEAAEWKSTQDGQRLLTTTPSVLGGCRAQVYRAGGATQWYTAVIVGVNEHTGELTVTDDTVLEEHNEDPALIQMNILGDGVVESIMRGEVVGVVPRRSRSSLQRIDRESTKSPAITASRKKSGTVKNNGQISSSDPPIENRRETAAEIDTQETSQKGVVNSGESSVSVSVGDAKEDRDRGRERVKCAVSGASGSGAGADASASAGASASASASAVASEEDDCVIVCARDAGRGEVRGGWREMAHAHGYGAGPPPPLLLPPAAPALYAAAAAAAAPELLWKQRAYPPPLHGPLAHHALPDDYLAATAASYDRERHERLLRERREQEREHIEKQQKEKERERIEREREREKQERDERERREEKERQENVTSKLVSRHFEESLRLANQKRDRNMSWSLLSSLGTSARAAGPGPEHERLRPPPSAPAPPPSSPYYPSQHPHPPPSSHQVQRPPSGPGKTAEYSCSPHSRLSMPTKPPDKSAPNHGGLPKSEPNFAAYGYSPYRNIKDGHLPAPPPLVPEKNSVIVKHDPKQIHLEQKHPYPSKPRADPAPHYNLPSRPYRTGLSPHAPPHPSHAPPDKSRTRLYQPPPAPPRSPAFYPAPSPPGRPQGSSPALHGYKPGSSPTPAHYSVAVEPHMPPAKADPPPVPYPPPSAYSSALRGRPPPVVHLSDQRPPPRAHGSSPPINPACQTQPLDLVAGRDDPDRLSPRRRFPPDPEQDAKRRRLDSDRSSPRSVAEPLIASAAASVPGRPHGSEPAPQAPGPPCDVRVPSADGSVETPERAAGASPAPSMTPSLSPAPLAPSPALPVPPTTPPADDKRVSPAPAPSPKDGGAPVRHLGKKAWLQRHETAPAADGDSSGGGGVCVTLPMTVATRRTEPEESIATAPAAPEDTQRVSAAEVAKPKTTKTRKPTKETNGRIADDAEDSSSSERESVAAVAKRKPPKAKRKKGTTTRKSGDEPKKKKASESGSESDKESDDKESDSGASGSGSGSTGSRRGGAGAARARGRRARGGGRGGRRRDEPPRRSGAGPGAARARGSDSFLQNGPCCEVAPRLDKCRECCWSPAQRDKDMPNIFCRFYAFRRLKYAKNRQLAIAGFSDPYKDAEEDDKKLWLSSSAGAAELDIEMSCFLLREIGDQFCELLQQEKEAEMHHHKDKTIAWKRVVQGVREMCDVCETTLFNFHWTCSKCGFVVCLDCYKSRISGESASSNSESNTSSGSNGERDSHGWLTCTLGGAHGPRRLLLTQIAAGGALALAQSRLHRARALFALPACACARQPPLAPADRRLRLALALSLSRSAKTIKKEEIKDENGLVNGTSPVKLENGKTASVKSWLADIPIKNETKEKEDKSDSSSSDSDESSFSTLRELLIRPATDASESQPSKKKQKKNKSDSLKVTHDVISSVVHESIRGEDEGKPFAISDVVKRYGKVSGHEDIPIRIMTLTESKVLYPDVPHSWLCDGKLLHLTDPTHPGNYKPFQDQWKRGQPVLVSDLSTILDKNLWTPESFSRDFGDTRVDLVNCNSGLVVPNQPSRKFWDGFAEASKRLRDDRNAPMVLKIKDWPPGEDFAELMPSRFDDLMRALPLAEYTSRHGRLNLAARLPECFVRPDLGPKMYTAYGGAGGTTNLHLDVSDAVNVLVHAGAPNDAAERAREAARAAEEAGVDVLSRERVRRRPPAALWHIYAARDADKIRDMLSRVGLERGLRPRADHDPVHDQVWYLDAALRERLYREYGVEGYAVLQCAGDAVFVPAGAPHQVRNLLDCIKVAEDFVSPENVSRCFELAQQFRRLSRHHANKEDKLQIKNVVYHAVKDSLCRLEDALAAAPEP